MMVNFQAVAAAVARRSLPRQRGLFSMKIHAVAAMSSSRSITSYGVGSSTTTRQKPSWQSIHHHHQQQQRLNLIPFPLPLHDRREPTQSLISHRCFATTTALDDNSTNTKKTTTKSTTKSTPTQTSAETSSKPGQSTASAVASNAVALSANNDNNKSTTTKKEPVVQLYQCPPEMAGRTLQFVEPANSNNTRYASKSEVQPSLPGLILWLAIWKGQEYTIGMPEGTPVTLCRQDPVHGRVPLEPHFDAMDTLFPLAAAAVHERFVLEPTRPANNKKNSDKKDNSDDNDDQEPQTQYEKLHHEFGKKAPSLNVAPGQILLQRTPQTLTMTGDGWFEDPESIMEDTQAQDQYDNDPSGPPVDEVLVEFQHEQQNYVLVRPLEPFMFVAKRHETDPQVRVLISDEEGAVLGPLLEQAELEFLGNVVDVEQVEKDLEQSLFQMERDFDKAHSGGGDTSKTKKTNDPTASATKTAQGSTKGKSPTKIVPFSSTTAKTKTTKTTPPRETKKQKGGARSN